jgi:hypothetical protein
MNTAVHTWFSDRWASSTSSAYWRTLPMLSMGKFLVAAFITWCAVGFVIDLLLVNYQPLERHTTLLIACNAEHHLIWTKLNLPF